MARILVIDDDAALRVVLRRILETAGHTVEEAADGEEGMRWCYGHQVDLVITDILMPGQEGIETIVTLQKDCPELKIIAISGGGVVSKNHYLEMAKDLGAHFILAKPLSQKELLKTVRAALDSSRLKKV